LTNTRDLHSIEAGSLYINITARKETMQKYGIVNVEKLNLRNSASTTAQVISQLARGTVLQILKDAGFDWLQVRIDGSTTQGFVAKPYLTLADNRPGTSPADPVSPVAPAAPTGPITPGGCCEVKTQSLNVRSGPGTQFAILWSVGQGAVLNVLGGDGGWVKVRIGTGEGYVAVEFVDLTTTKTATGYLIERSDLLDIDLVPDRVIPAQTANASSAVVARTWNNYGGLIAKLAAMLKIPLGGVVATLAAESGGTCFGPDGRLIIRFENHIFYQYWGQKNPETFDRFFAFDRSTPGNAWKGHLWRRDIGEPWQNFHGNQDLEWQVLTIGRALDDTAALSSISMGAPQVMGFNYRRLGYDSVQRMFYTFARSAHTQLMALFDFVRGMSNTSPAIQALQNRDFLTFANMYNGPANAPTYCAIIQRYSDLFDTLIKTATSTRRIP
jgi:uncharacterized protein YgiM (DUF1202 family)